MGRIYLGSGEVLIRYVSVLHCIRVLDLFSSYAEKGWRRRTLPGAN